MKDRLGNRDSRSRRSVDPPPRSNDDRHSNTPVTNLLSTGPVIAALSNKHKKSSSDRYRHSSPNPSSQRQDLYRNSPSYRGALPSSKLSPREREKASGRILEEEQSHKYVSSDEERKKYYSKERRPDRLARGRSQSPWCSDKKDIALRPGDKVDSCREGYHRASGILEFGLGSPSRERGTKRPLSSNRTEMRGRGKEVNREISSSVENGKDSTFNKIFTSSYLVQSSGATAPSHILEEDVSAITEKRKKRKRSVSTSSSSSDSDDDSKEVRKKKKKRKNNKNKKEATKMSDDEAEEKSDKKKKD